jgi:hypothetical protein
MRAGDQGSGGFPNRVFFDCERDFAHSPFRVRVVCRRLFSFGRAAGSRNASNTRREFAGRCRAAPPGDSERGGRKKTRRAASAHAQCGAAPAVKLLGQITDRAFGTWPNECKHADAIGDAPKSFCRRFQRVCAKLRRRFDCWWRPSPLDFLAEPKSGPTPCECGISMGILPGGVVIWTEIKFIFFLLTRINAISYAEHPA